MSARGAVAVDAYATGGDPGSCFANFDPALVSAIVGEDIPTSVLKRLKDVSGGNTERGMGSRILGVRVR